MKFLKSFLPNFTIALSAALIVLIYLDNRNPMMGFLYGKPFALLGITLALCSICVSVLFYISWQKEKNYRKKSPAGKFEKGTKQAMQPSGAAMEELAQE